MKPHKKQRSTTNIALMVKFNPLECPFREFRDNELSPEFWGMGPVAFRNANLLPKVTGKGSQAVAKETIIWVDEQTQPLPKSVRHYLEGWVPAEELAQERWASEVVVFDEGNLGKMSVIDYQLSHTQVLTRSSFCRKVLSACFNLERVENLPPEHQWDNFNYTFGPEGWRARYHIYSPGMKGGGGPQHRPTLSRNGCYLVRLYYLGAWRCVWVSDKVPVDASGAPLLPFSPLSSPSPMKGKGIPAMVTSPYVHLWPLLLCKALLKLGAPDMTNDEEIIPEEDEDMVVEDEPLPELDLMHALTGGFSIVHDDLDYETTWKRLSAEVRAFVWDDDYDDGKSSTAKSRSTKNAPPKDKDKEQKAKESTTTKSKTSKKGPKDVKDATRGSLTTILIKDTKDVAPYILPGISPALEMSLIVTMIRDIPLKRPLQEPELSLWKHYRWIDWARSHGLYEDYECPRTKFLKITSLMKLSYAPHLLDVQSTESITHGFREEQATEKKTKPTKDVPRQPSNTVLVQKTKEELREWVKYDSIQSLVKSINVVYYPSQFEFTTAASNPPYRIIKVPNRALDIQAPKASPLYLQIDGPEENTLRISLSMIHPRILGNNNFPIEDYTEKAYVLLECFEWFIDKELPLAKAFVMTRGYNSVEVKFLPGRYYCRLWVHSRMNWHMSLISESSIIMGTRDVIQAASCLERDWAAKFLNVLGISLANLFRTPRSITNIIAFDRDFFSSYQPDLTWDPQVVGYDKAFIHWMFRQALQSHLYKHLQQHDYQVVCAVLRKYFNDPDFGFPPKPKPPKSLREIAQRDPCDCAMVEAEILEEEEEHLGEDKEPVVSAEENRKMEVSDSIMCMLLKEPHPPVTSNVCEFATEELPCPVLKIEREKLIRKHEAATVIQSRWRGSFARKCLSEHVTVTPEMLKLLNDHVFGNLDMLSLLMNEFFLMFPGAKSAYSVSSALNGLRGLQQHIGTSPVTPKCKWIPYFQGLFYCHAPVKIHFDVHSTIEHSTVQIYDNDTGEMLPQAYNAHITFDIHPNLYGYTVLGHGSLNQPLGNNSEIHWQLTLLTSIDHVFHVCDNNDVEPCLIMPLTPASKLHLDEMYIPNRRNILGGIQISVSRVEAVSFRAAATTPDLEIEAILRTWSQDDGEVVELARCQGKGEIFWPYIRLKPDTSASTAAYKKISASAVNFHSGTTVRPKTNIKKPLVKSTSRMFKAFEPKTYTIEVIAPQSWALSIDHWIRIQEVMQDIEPPKYEPVMKKGKEKVASAKDKKKEADLLAKEAERAAAPVVAIHEPLPEDAYIEIECSTTVGGGALAKRDDDRDILYANALRSWDLREPGRNNRGAMLRQAFRDEFLVAPLVKSESTITELLAEEHQFEGEFYSMSVAHHRPSPAIESEYFTTLGELEEEMLYYTFPDCLKDKFVPLHFVPLCTRDVSEEGYVILTDEMVQAAKSERATRIESSIERMRQLQEFNQKHVLGRQALRIKRLEKLLVDASWNAELAAVMDERNEAIALEVLNRQQSAAKKKMEAKISVKEKAGPQKPEKKGGKK